MNRELLEDDGIVAPEKPSSPRKKTEPRHEDDVAGGGILETHHGLLPEMREQIDHTGS